MAHFCPDCKLTFENRVSNCPRCGYGIANDTQPESFYLNQGYTRFSLPRGTTNNIHIQDDDILNNLRDRYNNYINNTSPTYAPDSSMSENEQSGSVSPANDFFSSFTDTELQVPETNIEPESDPIPTRVFNETPRTNNYYSPRARSRRNRRTIPWRAIFYLAFFIVAIMVIVGIWRMRYVILDSIVSFIGSTIPIAIVVFAIIYLIRKLFKP